MEERNNDDTNCNNIVFDVKLVKGSDPILIEGDDEDNECNGYPPGYNKIFECVYPPEEWTENGKKWRRVASTESADRHQVIALSKNLKSNLDYWNAMMHGVCPVRRELFTQCFNELIRQVCVNSIDQGELLIKIRNQYMQSIIDHKRYYESGLIFRIKRASLNDNKNEMVKKDLHDLEDQQVELKKQLSEANVKYKRLEINIKKELNDLKDAHQHELNFFNRNHKALKDQLVMILSMNT